MNARATILASSAAAALLFGAAVVSARAADVDVTHHHHVRVDRARPGCRPPDPVGAALNSVAENGILNGVVGAVFNAPRPKFDYDDAGFTYDNGYRAYFACRGSYRHRGISARY